jgi:hypothetical protein
MSNRSRAPWRPRTRGQDATLALLVIFAFVAALAGVSQWIAEGRLWTGADDEFTIAALLLWVAALKRSQWECPFRHGEDWR